MIKMWMSILFVMAVFFLTPCNQVFAEGSSNWGDSVFMADESKAVIRQFITDFIDLPVEEFMKNRKENEESNEQFKDVPFSKLIGFIFSDPVLPQQIVRIMETKGKSNFFLMLLKSQMRKSKKAGTLDLHVSDLANFLHLDRSDISPFFNQERPRELIYYLLQFTR